MQQQLYINNVVVDMPAEEIKIKVESNIFTDVGNTMTAHSYSITLPRTMTNDAVFAIAYEPAANTGGKTTHKYLKASLYLDGVPLFEDGQCVVTAVEDKGYKCNLFWGLLSIFETVKEEGLNLCDLPMSKRWDASTMEGNWLKMSKYFGGVNNITGMNDDIYLTLDAESKTLADCLPWTMLSTKASDIFALIANVYGINFDMSPELNSRIGTIYHPLVTRKAMAKDETMKLRLGCYVVNPSSNVYLPQIYKPSVDSDGQYIYNRWQVLVPGYAQATSQPMANDVLYFEGSGATMNVRIRSKCAIKSLRVYGKCDKNFDVVCGIEEDPSQVVKHPYNDGNYYTIDYTWEDLTGEKDDIPIQITAGSGAYWTSAPQTLTVHFDFEVEEIDELDIGCWWNWVRNLPEINVIDYMNDILTHIGGCIVGSINKRDSLRMMTFDEIFSSSPQPLDTLGVKSITMSFGNLAQRNKYTHKDNEDTGVNYNGEGVILTEDETLATEHKAFESKFKVPRLALIRLWEVEKNSGESNYKAKWVAKGDYICGYDWGGMLLKNTGQDFATVIERYYVGYSEVMRMPKVIVATIRLSVLELLQLDMGALVYINQLNRAYAVKTLENEDGEKYKLTLVQV